MENMWGIPKKPLCNRAKLWWAEFKSYNGNGKITLKKKMLEITTKNRKSQLGQWYIWFKLLCTKKLTRVKNLGILHFKTYSIGDVTN